MPEEILTQLEVTNLRNMGTDKEPLREVEIPDDERLEPPVGYVDGVLQYKSILLASLNVRGINERPKYIKIINQLAINNY